MKEKILLSYYGDDFTGSADVMESLSLRSIPTILFLESPTLADLENFKWKNPPQVQNEWMAFGVAGVARSLSPAEMEAELESVFHSISQIPFRFFHYKICSTLDSTPEVGNIGKALEIAERYFPSPFIPFVMGPPVLNRFVVFGNLFARIGEKTYRLDRHPVMSKHPVTPMRESDISRHLQKQTNRNIALMDFFALEKAMELTPELFFKERESSHPAPLLLFDTLEDRHLNIIGHWIDKFSREKHQLLLGSSGVEYALGSVYGQEVSMNRNLSPTLPTLIVAGSCSQNTADQILHVKSLGYHCIRLEVGQLLLEKSALQEEERVLNAALSALKVGKHTVIFSALGPDDPHVTSFLDNKVMRQKPQLIAEMQGRITRNILDAFALKRLVTAGGDTSGYILKSLNIKALEFKSVLAPGAPLCIAHADSENIDGLEIAVKGGQNGTFQYFEFAQQGGIF